MKRIHLGKTDLEVPNIGLGCLRIVGLSPNDAAAFVETAYAHGANFFDVADSYHEGRSEEALGQAIRTAKIDRLKLFLQTKCGIYQRSNGSIVRYDLSKKHTIECAEGSLRRLGVDYLDVLLLHRPDALMEPEEVAEAFQLLSDQHKVRYFGVSNQNPAQMRLLKRYLTVPIIVNQLQLSVAHAGMIDLGMNVNMENAASADHDGGVLDYCRLHDITIQPWSPFQYGFMEGVFIGDEKYAPLNRTLERIGEKYGVTNTAMALAWLLRHPAKMQPIIGTMKRERLIECLSASEIQITREEWYEIYLSANRVIP